MTQEVKNPEIVETANQKLSKEPIAIIGIGCRFPGNVNGPDTFWQLLRDEKDAITEMPVGRFDIDSLYDPTPATPGKIITRSGGFVENIDQFDASFFGISPREANYMDPQQRLLLEIAWEALEDGGQVPDKLKGSQTGIFIGMWTNEYEDRMYRASDDIDLYITTGGGRYSVSGRLSYIFDFRGPSLTVDTACSSSLVTVHLACQSLWQGESTLALAGGVNLLLEPHITIGYSRSGMLSPDGRCKFGDAQANGYVRSEGAGIVVLKPLSQALSDNDRIYALIRGSAVNNDGRSSERLVAPGVETQIAMLRQAYQDAGVSPGQVGFVEAHGTGTKVGDPVELKALGTVLAENRSFDRPCLIGSVKTNIGHTEAASGIAGLIKAALCLTHQAIPASLHLREHNPDIPWSDLPIVVPKQWSNWPKGYETAFAGVNSFGVTGTNAHLVLQQSPASVAPDDGKAGYVDQIQLLPLSARTPETLMALARAYKSFVTAKNAPALADICYTASVRRPHHDHRLAVVASTREEVAARLDTFIQGEIDAGIAAGQKGMDREHKVVFIFPGQGSQWLGMGRELLAREPVFRQSLEKCEVAMQPFVDWSLLEQLTTDEESASYRLDQIDVIQPTLLSIEIALAELWRAWGVKPDAVIGHSMGEVGAAYVAGALNLEDAMRVICRRSQLLRRTSGQGAMAVVDLTVEEAEKALAGYEDRLSVAVSNSPRSTVLSGDPEALDEVLTVLRAQDVFCRLIKVDVASHSPQMDPLKPDLLAALTDLQPRAASVPIYSAALSAVTDGADYDAEYWVQNLRRPVMFSRMVQQLLADGHNVFIEMSPHPILLPAVQQGIQHAGQEGLTLASTRRNEPEQASMLASLGSLYVAGFQVDWQRFYPSGRCVSLPLYPWQRERFWYESLAARNGHSRQTRPGSHPFLQTYLSSATGAHVWETELSAAFFPYLQDHRVGGTAVLPAAATTEMVLAAAHEAYGEGTHVLENVVLKEALVLPAEDAQIVQLVVTDDMPGTAAFQLFGRTATEEKDQVQAWTLYASGTIRLATEAAATIPAPQQPLPETAVAGEAHYQAMAERGLQYGPAFQSVAQFWPQEDSVVADLQLPETVAANSGSYRLHPSLLDAGLQLLLATLYGENGAATDTYLPVSMEKVHINGRYTPGTTLRGQAIRHENGEMLVGDVFLYDEEGQLVMAGFGVRMQRLPQDETASVTDWLYEIKWQPQPLPEQMPAVLEQPGRWLIFADAQGPGAGLVAQLGQSGAHCVTVSPGTTYQCLSDRRYTLDPTQPEQFSQLLEDIVEPEQPLRGIVHLWGLAGDIDVETTLAGLHAAQEQGVITILHLLQAVNGIETAGSPQLYVVTQNAQAVTPGMVNVPQSPMWGLSRVIAHEHPELRCRCIDLDDDTTDMLIAELRSDDGEDQVAYRDGNRYVARLVRYLPQPETKTEQLEETAAVKQPFRVVTTKPGILDHLALHAINRPQPKAHEVEIEVHATGLNFMNVMAALGVLPGYENGVGPLGIECAGKVVAVGDDVTDFAVGDEVVALAFDSLGTHAVADVHLVAPKPAHLTFAEAATIPIVFLTAYYALHRLGRLEKGERVLIHAAAGGVGLAAVQLAQQANAEIFATAGNVEKREFLRKLGIKHVLDSRSLAFADEIIAQTDNEGVDIVLNSLAGEAVMKGLQVLRPYGRFLEIGKRDIYQNSKIGLLPFQRNLSYFAIDLDKMARERPVILGKMLRDIMRRVEAGELRPLPLKLFPISDVVEAFHYMAQAKHIGKVVVSIRDTTVSVVSLRKTTDLRPNKTYLITGGLGGLGLTVARWFVEQGARHLVLVGRSGASSLAQAIIDELETEGAQVVVAQADVTQLDDVANVLTQIRETLPPLRGIVHAAGILADGTLSQMDQALAPKLDGAWHLHHLTRDLELDFFILFSSATALLGTPGQGNYAAANAFLDALAHHRRAQGQAALSINWGPWSDVGLAAAQANRGDRLVRRGLGSITPEQGIATLARLFDPEIAQVGVMPFNLQQWSEYYPAAVDSPFLAILREEVTLDDKPKEKETNIRESLLAAEPGRQRRSLFESHLRAQVAQVLRLAPSRVPLDKPLKTLGLDSLMTLELRNRLEASLGLTLSATFIWNYPTIVTLVLYLAEKMDIALDTAIVAEETTSQEVPSSSPTVELKETLAQDLDNLGKDELEVLLAEELSAIDDQLKGS